MLQFLVLLSIEFDFDRIFCIVFISAVCSYVSLIAAGIWEV